MGMVSVVMLSRNASHATGRGKRGLSRAPAFTLNFALAHGDGMRCALAAETDSERPCSLTCLVKACMPAFMCVNVSVLVRFTKQEE